MAEWKVKKTLKKNSEADKEEAKRKNDLEDRKKSEKERAEEKEETDDSFKISSIGLGEFGKAAAESLESEIEDAGIKTEGEEIEGGEGSEDFESFVSPMRVHDITAPVLVSSPEAGSGAGIEEAAGIAETEGSMERREQATRTIAEYTPGVYEKNYWTGGEEKRRQARDMEMSIIPLKPIREIMEIPDETRRIDFSAWQRQMEMQSGREAGRRERDSSEEYLVDVRREKEDTRLPFERREEKRKYRP